MLNERLMLRFLLVRVTAALMLAVSMEAAAASDSPKTALKRCWGPQIPAGTAKERTPVRRRTSIDMAGLRGWKLAPALPTQADLRGSIRRVDLPPDKKLIALTFDLCETPYSIAGYDGGIVNYLRENDIKSTFFASGKWIETHGERAQQLIADPLFELGNHGMEHRDFRRTGGALLRDEIALAQAAYERSRAHLEARSCLASEPGATLQSVPERMTLFRFPYGTCNARALTAVAEAGLQAIQWDIVTGDPDRGRSARSIAATVLARARPGSIVIAHANGRGWNTAAALPLIIPRLKAQGYEFVTVSELLAAGKPVIAKSCYEYRPGDNAHLHTLRARKKKKERKYDSDRPALFEISD